jgi:hypothetical protein
MKTKILMTIALGLITLFNTYAESPAKIENSSNSLTGTIIDSKTGEFLAGVEVMIEGSDLKTYTDFEGKFSFDTLKSGEYKIKTNYLSYDMVESRSIKINTNEMHALNIELQATNSNLLNLKTHLLLIAGSGSNFLRE